LRAVLDRDAQLLEVVAALHARGSLADFLHGGQEQADEDGDDGDHHQQLDQRDPRQRPNTRRNNMDLPPKKGKGRYRSYANGPAAFFPTGDTALRFGWGMNADILG
jgi:hypothetical protein